MKDVLQNRLFLAIASGHTVVDVLNSTFPVILATLALQLGLTNTQVGVAATIFMLGASVTQPIFGYVADQWGSRLLAVGGVTWMAGGFATAAFLDGIPALIALVIAGLGSAAYHPQATMNARTAAGHMAASGTSLFFLFGQVGLASGPALAGVLLSQTSLRSTLLILTLPAMPIILFLLGSVPRRSHRHDRTASKRDDDDGALRLARPVLIAFILLLAFRMWPMGATQTFLPKLMGDAGLGADRYGVALALFMIGSATGVVIGGYSGDRWSSKGTIVLTLLLAPLPLWAYLQLPLDHLMVPVIVGVAGFLLGAPHGILVMMAQSMLPGRMALASGLALGFMFSSGAAASLVTGVLADYIGLHLTLQLIPFTAVAAALCALALPRRQTLERREPVSPKDSRIHTTA